MELTDFSKKVLSYNGLIEHEIDGVTYTIKLLPALTAMRLAKQVATTITPLLGVMWDNKEEYLDEDFGISLGLMVSKQLSELDLTSFTGDLLKGALVEGKSLDINSLVGAKGLMVVYELTELSLRANVLDFLFELLERKGFKIPSLDEIKMKSAQTHSESSN